MTLPGSGSIVQAIAARYGFGPRLGWRVLGGPWVGGENDAYGHIIERWDRP